MKKFLVLFLLLSAALYSLPEGAYQTADEAWYYAHAGARGVLASAHVMRIVYLDGTFMVATDYDDDLDFSDEEIAGRETYESDGMVMCKFGEYSFGIAYNDDFKSYMYTLAKLPSGEGIMGKVYLIQRAQK